MVSYSIIFLASSLFHLLSLFNFFHFLFHSSFSFSHSLISIGIFVERQMWKCSYCVHTYTIYIYMYIYNFSLYIYRYFYICILYTQNVFLRVSMYRTSYMYVYVCMYMCNLCMCIPVFISPNRL